MLKGLINTCAKVLSSLILHDIFKLKYLIQATYNALVFLEDAKNHLHYFDKDKQERYCKNYCNGNCFVFLEMEITVLCTDESPLTELDARGSGEIFLGREQFPLKLHWT